MFDSLFNLVKENAGDAIINNPVIPNEKNDDAIAQSTTSIMNTLKEQVSSGNMNNIMDLFKQSGGTTNNNPVMSAMNNNLISELMGKFGVEQNQAGNIASTLIPQVMDKLVTKTNDPNDASFTMDGVMSSIGGTGGLGDLAKNIFG